MIIVMKSTAGEPEVESVLNRIRSMGLTPQVSQGAERTIIGVIGGESIGLKEEFSELAGVESVVSVLKPYTLVSRENGNGDAVVRVGPVNFGSQEIVVIAGPCSVESEDQLMRTAAAVKAAGASLLRGGAFKPRSSPYSFQGLGREGLKLLAQAREVTGMGIVTEVMESGDVALVAEYADMLQVGARNMQNTNLLRTLAKTGKPVLLKRNFSATLNEFLMSAEYLLAGGNDQVVLCERGIRTFVDYTRNTLDLNIVPALKELSRLPIIVDPSHGTGRSDLVIPMSRASIAAGADGLMVEVHPDPSKAFSDGNQALTPPAFEELMQAIQKIAAAVGRTVQAPRKALGVSGAHVSEYAKDRQ